MFKSKNINKEAVFYRDILAYDYNQWKDLDYVGMISYKAVNIKVNNMTFSLTQIPHIITKSYNIGIQRNISYDIIPFLMCKNYTLLTQAVSTHGHDFTIAWDMLLQALGYNLTQIRSVDYTYPFFRNSFIGKPSWMAKYSVFVNQAMDMVIYNETISSLFAVNANYDAPKVGVAEKVFETPYYQLHPFIFERLPVFYFNMHRAMIYES
jgi:hypothetical protein